MIARSVESRGDGTLCTIWLPDESCRKLYCAAAPSLPDAYTVDQFFLDRLGNDAIQLDLLYGYQSNVELYEKWHEYFRVKQPRMLIVWGINDPFFTLEGAKAYQRDIPNAELHLIDTGHFALEDSSDFIAERIKQFLKSHMPSQAPAHA